MSPFQQKIYDFLHTRPNRHASTWAIAHGAFPEKWAKRAGRGVLIAHIRKACDGIPGAVWLAPDTYPSCGCIALSNLTPKPSNED